MFGARQPSTLVLVLALVAAGCSQTQPTSPPSDGGTDGDAALVEDVRILNWNTHDFYGTTSASQDIPTLTTTAYQNKITSIGAEIHALSPDVVMLAEIGSLNVLQDLNDKALGGAYGTQVMIEGNDPRGINIGLLSKLTPDSFVSHKDDTFTVIGENGPNYHYSRDCLEVHFTVGTRELVLLGVHFKAKSPTDDPDKRLAEAQHTRAIADQLAEGGSERAILILGDFNDVPSSAPLAAVAGNAPSMFIDSAASATSGDRYSYDFESQLELIDHQMANPVLSSMLDPTGVVIAHGTGIDDGSASASDHAPVLAVYKIR